MSVFAKLRGIFDENVDKRILVLGTSCCGKTTLLRDFPEGRDMDELIWAMLPEETQKRLDNTTWDEDMQNIWRQHVIDAKQIIKIEPGHPLFAATLFASDIIVYLNIREETLRERVKKRGEDYAKVAANNERIKEEIRVSGLPVIVVDIMVGWKPNALPYHYGRFLGQPPPNRTDTFRCIRLSDCF
ncbi:MAG: AAA family ATPase [Defluviitaleaceae bacterium]|nr:AAA family ATPase [Defluviitaleaceae bacterium]